MFLMIDAALDANCTVLTEFWAGPGAASLKMKGVQEFRTARAAPSKAFDVLNS